MSSRPSKKRARQTGPASYKRTKLSAPTYFPRVANKTEAKNKFEYHTISPAIPDGDIHMGTLLGPAQGVADDERIGKAITTRYVDLRWVCSSQLAAPTLRYRVIFGVYKSLWTSGFSDADMVLEPITSGYNILRAINGVSSKYVTVLHDKIYQGATPATTGNSTLIKADFVRDHHFVRIPYKATQTFSIADAESFNNFRFFYLIINDVQGFPMGAALTTNTYYTDA